MRGMLLRVQHREVLAHVDLELLAVARLDVRLVGGAAVAVGLGAHDRRARVLGQHGGLDLCLGVPGQGRLVPVTPAGAAAGSAAATTALVGLYRGCLE